MARSDQAEAAQPPGLTTRSVEAGFAASLDAGRRGRGSSSPPQLGQVPFSVTSAQVAQKVHSNEQMRASVESGGRGLSQHSQLGRSWSMEGSVETRLGVFLYRAGPQGASMPRCASTARARSPASQASSACAAAASGADADTPPADTV